MLSWINSQDIWQEIILRMFFFLLRPQSGTKFSFFQIHPTKVIFLNTSSTDVTRYPYNTLFDKYPNPTTSQTMPRLNFYSSIKKMLIPKTSVETFSNYTARQIIVFWVLTHAVLWVDWHRNFLRTCCLHPQCWRSGSSILKCQPEDYTLSNPQSSKLLTYPSNY